MGRLVWRDRRPVIIRVVGLGPGDSRYLTDHTRQILNSAERAFLRTNRHPSAAEFSHLPSFDNVYETGSSFSDVYESIVDHLVDAARDGEVVYAVPGSPLILEDTVRRLQSRPGIQLVVEPAMSFLDLVWPALNIDPIESSVRLVDGHTFASSAAGETGPLLVAHCHANWVLSDIKLAIDIPDDSAAVVILKSLGTPQQELIHTTWAEMDRVTEADHLTSLFIPQLAIPVAHELQQLHQLSLKLREECPWDREQTHATLIRYLIEEAYEVVEALDEPIDDDHLIEELGDLLYQIEFHCAIAQQEGRFTIADVARNLHDKMVRRHPHVFGREKLRNPSQVLRRWHQLKQQEKPTRKSCLDGIPKSLPALLYAQNLQRRAARGGFDWPDPRQGIPAKIREELRELSRTRTSGPAFGREMGDVLFTLVNLARHRKV
ncbi:MAG: nucleoside triphosphate pyrophosphohydrolase, partial [Actinobacteria bacterium]|nr:nucleoside triphosphate pyrophosphohydrolase [Actinomycetota bacterium]